MTPTPRLWRAVPRLTAYALLNLILVPLYAAMMPFGMRRWQRSLEILYSRIATGLMGLKLRVDGQVQPGGAILFVSNHVSYLDIPVLRCLLDASFIAKSEVADWPLFGLISRLTRTVFVQRRGSEALNQRRELQTRLAAGNSLILFPEGTTTDGVSLAPFKSSLFSIVDTIVPGGGVTVQPMSIAYVRYADGTPLTGSLRHLYTWAGEAALMPHLLRVAGLKGAEVRVRIHPPIRPGTWTDRKDLARQLQAVTAEGLSQTWEDVLDDPVPPEFSESQRATSA